MSVELEMCNRFQGTLAIETCPSRIQHLARTSRLTCLHTLPQQSHIHPQWRLLFSLSLRLLSAGIAFNVLEGRSLTACPPFLSLPHPPAPQFTLRLNCSNFTPLPSDKIMDSKWKPQVWGRYCFSISWVTFKGGNGLHEGPRENKWDEVVPVFN